MNDKLFLLVAGYFYIISLASVVITIYDKQCAISQSKRISEKTFFVLALLGGSLAMFITMLAIRHKIRRIKFMLGIPLMMAVQCLAAYCVFNYIL